MSAWPRRIGWLLMVLALAAAWGGRSMGVTHYGPFPAVVVALFVGGIGVMLVVTDIMVRGLYAQVGAAAAQDCAPAEAGALTESAALASQGSGLRRSAAGSESVAAGDAAVGGDGDDVAVGGDLDRA